MAKRLSDLVDPTLSRGPAAGKGLTLDSQGRIPYELLGTRGPSVLEVGEYMSWNGTDWVNTSTRDAEISVQVVTAIGDATAFDGAQAMVRAGSSPYQFVNLTYDSTYGKWVSPPVQVYGDAEFTTTWTHVSSPVVLQHHAGFIGFDCDAIYDDGGLRPQFMGGYSIAYSASAPNLAAAGFQIYESNNNEEGVPSGESISSTFLYGEHTPGLTTWSEKHFDWQQVTPTGTAKQGWSIRLVAKVTSPGTGSIWGAGVFMRWVSA